MFTQLVHPGPQQFESHSTQRCVRVRENLSVRDFPFIRLLISIEISYPKNTVCKTSLLYPASLAFVIKGLCMQSKKKHNLRYVYKLSFWLKACFERFVYSNPIPLFSSAFM